MMKPATGLALALAIALQAPALLAAQASGPVWSARASSQPIVEEREFLSAGIRLSGTLYLPQQQAPAPAVVVFHAASAPTRNLPLYQHLVQMLPPLGAAVFVFDRRGSGNSGGDLATSDYRMLADDGIAAQQMLSKDERIDNRRIGFWGLSQGGWLALLAATRSVDSAFAISISAPLVTPDVQMNFAVENVMRIHGFDEPAIDRAIATRRAVDDYMRGSGDQARAQSAINIAVSQPWFDHAYLGRSVPNRKESRWAKEMAHDPMATLRSVKIPTLLVYGAADPWVPVGTSITRVRTELSNTKIEWAVIAGADHEMATNVPLLEQVDPNLADRHAPNAPEYFGLLANWLTAKGIASR